MANEVDLNDEAIRALFADPTGPVGQAVEATCYRVENIAKRKLLEPGTGRIYRRRGRFHQASAPGESPVSDTGQLLNSTGHSITVEGGLVTGRVGSGEKKALWLELGTRYMAPRPWLRPALAEGTAEEAG